MDFTAKIKKLYLILVVFFREKNEIIKNIIASIFVLIGFYYFLNTFSFFIYRAPALKAEAHLLRHLY